MSLARAAFNVVNDHLCCFIERYAQNGKVGGILKALKVGVVFALRTGKVSFSNFVFATLYSHQHDVLLSGDEVDNIYSI
jgi:hypothetical protein